MKTSRFLFLLATLPVTGRAQLLTFGFQGGAPAETPLSRGTTKMPFAFGPVITLQASSRLSIESGMLYYRLGDRNDNFAFPFPENAFTLGLEQWRGKALEIPFLLKYRFLNGRRAWQPFVSAGPAVRRTAIDFTSYRTVFPLNSGTSEPARNEKSVKWNVDPVAAVGVSFRMGRLNIRPQVRYSYWGSGKNSVVRKNQVHFLFGFRF